MRRVFYRLTCAVLTFVVGFWTAGYFQRPTHIPGPVKISAPPPLPAKAQISLSCDDELLRRIADELLRDEAFVDYLAYDNLETFRCSENFETERVELNRDGTSEIVVQGLNKYLCSPTGNCTFWVYRATAGGYEKLLEASDVQQYYFRNSFNNGYRDITTAMHGSAWDSDLSVYKFDGTQYRLKECLSRSYGYLDNRGRFRETTKPIIKPVTCQAED